MDTPLECWFSDLEMSDCSNFGGHDLYSNGLNHAPSFDDLVDYNNFQETLSPEVQMCNAQHHQSDSSQPLMQPPVNITSSDLGSQNKAKGSQKRSDRFKITKSHSEAQDRVVLERKRREKLNQRFIALSAVIPNLKKMDKATVLEDAVRHLKHLQEQVAVLEEKLKEKSEITTVVPMKKPGNISSDDSGYSSDENMNPAGSMVAVVLPQLEVMVSKRSVLIKIQCKKQKGLAGKLLIEVEMLDLSICNSIFFPSGQDAIDVTIFTQMENGCDMTMEELKRKLHSVLEKL